MSQILHDLGWRDLKLKTAGGTFDWLCLLYKIVTGHVVINPDQIGLVHGGAIGWAGWAMAHPIILLGGPQCNWPTQYLAEVCYT